MLNADRDILDRVPPRIYPATIATVDTDTLAATVQVHAWDGGEHRHGPCPYVIQGATHPQRGESCVVVEDTDGGLWIASWTPGAFVPGPTVVGYEVGDIKFAAANPQIGVWLPCGGQAVSRSTYDALFAAIGTTYGAGNGTSTFGVPDLRDRALVGAGPGHPAGDKWGLETVTLTAAQSGLPAHSHALDYAAAGAVGSGQAVPAQPDTGTPYNTRTSTGQPASQAHPNAQPSLAIPAYILAAL